MAEAATNDNSALVLDAAVIGAGVAGLYELHLLREQGLNVRCFDTASGVGGTWYWNRYPGAKFDSEAYIYQYLFSEELYKNWSWSERFPRLACTRLPQVMRTSTGAPKCRPARSSRI